MSLIESLKEILANHWLHRYSLPSAYADILPFENKKL